MQTFSVIIASRLARSTRSDAGGELFVEAAIRSVRAQTAAARLHFEIIVGIDRGAAIPARLAEDSGIRIAEGDGPGQSAALNAAAAHADGDFITFLEDDDLWDPHFVEIALAALALKGFAFASSSQLEVGETGQPLRLMDFPTMSSWLMPRKTWETVGRFDASYRWHLDNDWLGRLAAEGLPRCHLVEADAPTTLAEVVRDRPALETLFKHSLGRVELVRHGLPRPLVRRLIHVRSGLGQIATDAAIKAESEGEYQRLLRDYGRLPW